MNEPKKKNRAIGILAISVILAVAVGLMSFFFGDNGRNGKNGPIGPAGSPGVTVTQAPRTVTQSPGLVVKPTPTQTHSHHEPTGTTPTIPTPIRTIVVPAPSRRPDPLQSFICVKPLKECLR